MSHLPLDARAILEYLNELGYRNVSAEQLKEFMKGMHRHSEISSSKGKQQQKPKGNTSNSIQQQQKLPTTTTATTSAKEAATTTRASSPKQQQPRTPVKIIKSKRPLCHFRFYLDICDHQLAKKIEIRIQQLGGSLEFFLTPSVTHFITDKTVLPPTVSNNNNTLSSRPGTPQTPLTPGTPQTPYSQESYICGGDNKKNVGVYATTPTTTITTTPSGSRRAPIRQTRADAILNRARRGQNSTIATIASPTGIKKTNDIQPTSTKTLSTKCSPNVDNNYNQPYIVWQTEQALRFFAKVQHDLKEYLVSTVRERKSHSSKSTGAFVPTYLKGNFIKIESIKRNYRPYYQLFKKPTEWPKIQLTREDGAFRLSPKKEFEIEQKRMTRKSRSRSSQRQHVLPTQVQALKKNETGAKSSASQKAGSNVAGTCKQVKETSEKQCGVCEICKIEYDTLTIHLKTKDHEYFANNPQNFIALDTLIQASADVNKFLKEDKPEDEMELEEMEVEEQDARFENDVAQDPLENFVNRKADMKCLSASSIQDVQCNSLSPGVRERSKRITKGKHSSEKFQNNLQRKSSKSPKGAATPKSSSPKKSTSLTVSITTANATANTSAKVNEVSKVLVSEDMQSSGVVTRKKQATTTSVYSPPIRAMLPPSSMYKVVDTIQEAGTPQRKMQGCEQAVGSPSIIVKFKKVRQPESCRLSGEAGTFMFRKQRTSSELPTDLDRQTTSDNLRANNSAASSTSLDSSINDSIRMELESEKTDGCTVTVKASNTLNKKAIAIAKRRKGKASLAEKNKEQAQKATKMGRPCNNQRFPTAPIQPEVQLKTLRNVKSASNAIPTCVFTPNVTSRLTVPEATRKSSRTATAIVTAATTSSRLLRAAVEAAKKANSENGAASSRVAKGLNTTQVITQRINEITKVSSPEKPVTKLKRNSRLSVVKMEDRMGESGSLIAKNDNNSSSIVSRAKRNSYKKNVTIQIEDDMDDEDYDDVDDEDEDEDDGDEDFILNSRVRNKPVEFVTKTNINPAATREERAARRWSQRMQSLEISDYLADETFEIDVQCDPPKQKTLGRRKVATKVCSPRAKKGSQCESKKPEGPLPIATKKLILTSPPQRIFDITKSERIPKQHYSFERLPVTDLWYRVYTRQDTCEERYFEYYGSKNYRKLPYEMGPIPFDFTLTGSATHCTLCQKSGKIDVETQKSEEQTLIMGDMKVKQEDQTVEEQLGVNSNMLQSESQENPGVQSICTQSYTHKHKKLHLLQRYRQEQRQLMLQKQQLQQQDTLAERTSSNITLKCDSKASSPDREPERERAGSTHSNTSSCTASSTATFNSKQIYRNKHVNKAAFLSLELPPRKSPREHASTLALVSCIIRQRQDSMSKTNSETDEPASQAPASPHTPLLPVGVDVPDNKPQSPVEEDKPPSPVLPEEVRSPRPTRSASATPVEELRFATEISENVKRMRRGQNKYDHSPPIVLKTARAARGKCKSNPSATTVLDRRSFKAPSTQQVVPQNIVEQDQRRRPRSLLLPARVGVPQRRTLGRPPKAKNSLPSVRKTGSKKGVLEFEMDNVALKGIKAAMAPQRSIRQLEWEIDKYLELAANDVNCEDMADLLIKQPEYVSTETSSDKPSLSTSISTSVLPIKSKKLVHLKSAHKTSTDYAENTPPPTDYFSSDFDLYDLFTGSNSNGIGSGQNTLRANKAGNLSLYSSVALQNYFRKRKNLKSNRTGWPKAQKKKPLLRHQHGLRQKIRFLPKIEQSNVKADVDNDAASTQDVDSMNGDQNRRNSSSGNGVITPPDSDADDSRTLINGNYGGDGNGEYLDAIDDIALEVGEDERIPREVVQEEDYGETMADSIEIERCYSMGMDVDMDAAVEADIEADAEEYDGEEEDDDDDDVDRLLSERIAIDNADIDDEATTMFMGKGQRNHKRLRQSTDVISSSGLKHVSRNSLHPDVSGATASLTSTPSTTSATANMLRGLRRTPVLLNGSLESCISPSEKAGDNSDIFTVSSDGLDTDLDLSNSHTQYRTGDDEHKQQHETSCPHRTPKRKYDISKYAPNNKNSRTCAAEAATAAVKSLAISQFLKKEVRVTCRRLRPPFRRFRFRR